MRFFKKLFGKANYPSKNAKKIIDFFGCKCEYFPRSVSNQALIQRYFEAHKKWRKGGDTFPIIIVVDDTLSEWLSDIVCEGKTPEQLRNEILSNTSNWRKKIIPDGKTKEQIREEARSNACADGKRIIQEFIEMRREEIELEIAKRKQEQESDVTGALEDIACAQIIE